MPRPTPDTPTQFAPTAPRAGDTLFEGQPLPATLPSVAALAPIPPQVAAAATGMPAPLTLAGVHAKLCKPFAQALVEVKPQATTRDKKRALAVPYVDPRAYQTRLDRVVGPEGWTVSYRRLSERAVVCRSTILGVPRDDVGEAEAEEFDRASGEMKPNPNQATAAAMQAFKRVCASFGLGRYLYQLQQVWGDYDAEKKTFVDPAALVWQMYQTAGSANGE